MKNHVAPQLSLSRAVLLAVAAVAALAGPILLGIERGIPAEVSPAGIGEAPPSPAPQGGPRGGGPDTSSVQGYRIGEIRVAGTRLFNDDRIRSVLGLTSGEVYDELQLRKGFEDLQRLYGNRGYINFLPQPVFDVDEQLKLVNLTINISEGLPFVVNRISFTGNTTTTDETLRREILIKEGEVFNASLLELSRARLNQLGTLEEVKIEDYWVRPSSEEGRVDISLRVKEKGR